MKLNNISLALRKGVRHPDNTMYTHHLAQWSPMGFPLGSITIVAYVIAHPMPGSEELSLMAEVSVVVDKPYEEYPIRTFEINLDGAPYDTNLHEAELLKLLRADIFGQGD